MVKKGNIVIIEVLVTWINAFPEDATWKNLLDLRKKLPYSLLILKDNDVGREGELFHKLKVT